MGFALAADTERLLKRDLGCLNAISGDRVRHEIERVFGEERPGEILRAAQELGILEAIHPALRTGPSVLARLSALPTGPAPHRDLLLLAMLVFDVPIAEFDSLVSRLNMDSAWSRTVRDVGRVRDAFPRLRSPGVRRAEVYGLLHEVGAVSIEGCALATDEQLVSERLELYLSDLRHVKPLLGGDDLLALGVPQGPLVGKLLGKLLTARLEGLVSTWEDEERMVVRSLERADR
jgi:tRNA nucleotidyltransferase (CCA-adding enzyme)